MQTTHQTPAIDPRVADFVEDARKKLVDTGARNRLIHVNRQGRGRFLTIINERADEVYRILCGEARTMRFHPAETDADEAEGDAVRLDEADLSGFSGVREVDESRFTDRLLDTTLGTDALQKRVLQLARDARTAEEEQGINILFLAVGFLRWFEDERSQAAREAPLLLLPVELVRNERTSTYDVRAREDDILTNLPLQARLRDDFGLSLPEVELDEEQPPSAYFDRVREAVSGKPRWNIDGDGMQLGFFSFAKQLMQHDLEQEQWPEGSLGGDATIRNLMAESFAPEPPLFPRDRSLDEHLAPEDIVQVIEADAPQTKVIEEVRRGRHLVVQGPPGTGKSQTITNIIAAAVHDGKTVLFMAEKMAALDVVHTRMQKCGLGDLCLELHSRHANRREVMREIEKTLNARKEDAPAQIEPSELRDARDELNRISGLLHGEVANQGYTAFDAIAEVVGFMSSGREPPALSAEGLAELSREECERLGGEIMELGRLLENSGPRLRHPFAGCRELGLTPIDQQRLTARLSRAIEAIDAAAAESAAFGRDSGGGDAERWAPAPDSIHHMRRSAALLDLLAEPPAQAISLSASVEAGGDVEQLADSLHVGAAWAAAKERAAPMFREDAWDVPALELQHDLERGAAGGIGGFFARMGSAYRRAGESLDRLTVEALPADPRAGRAGDDSRRRAARAAQAGGRGGIPQGPLGGGVARRADGLPRPGRRRDLALACP